MHIGIDASRAFLKEKTGTEEYSYQLIKAVAKIDRKNTYTLYVKDTNYQILNTNYPLNFKFKVIPWSYLWTQGGLALECLKNPPDVLFVPAHTLPILRRPGLKTVVTIHDLGAEFLPQHHQLPNKLYLNKSTEYAVRHATHLIAVSQSTKDDLITKLHCDIEKMRVVYEGYDEEKFKVQSLALSEAEESKLKVKELKEKYGVEGNYILFVGTIQPRKNLVRLIEAFGKILRNEDIKRKKEKISNISKFQYPNISLLIVGKPGWMYEEIYAAPKKFSVEGKVKFLNYVPREELPLFYQNALCLALPSLYEGFGLPVLEAMACGCPVVVSNSSSPPELVGEAGILVDPYNVEDIAKNLQLIVNNLQLWETLRKRGLMQVKKFSWEKCARETLAVLETVGKNYPASVKSL